MLLDILTSDAALFFMVALLGAGCIIEAFITDWRNDHEE